MISTGKSLAIGADSSSTSVTPSSSASAHVKGCQCDLCQLVMLSKSPSLESSGHESYGQSPVLTGEELKQAKRNLVAVPAGLYQQALHASLKNKPKKGKKRDLSLVSKMYNTVASRPNLCRVLTVPMITVEMSLQQTAFTTSNVATVYYSNYFTLNGWSNYTEYTSLFDQYKIEEIECWIEPFETQSSVQALSGTLTSAVDIDDANTPTTIASVQDHQGAIVTNGVCGHYHRWKPHMAIAVYSGAFTSFANAPASWIDCASPGVQHYGVKTAITATTNAIPYSLIAKALISFRSCGI